MIEQQILQQLKMLPAVKQVEVLDFTEFLVKQWFGHFFKAYNKINNLRKNAYICNLLKYLIIHKNCPKY